MGRLEDRGETVITPFEALIARLHVDEAPLCLCSLVQLRGAFYRTALFKSQAIVGGTFRCIDCTNMFLQGYLVVDTPWWPPNMDLLQC
jgi:hypothetical protein